MTRLDLSDSMMDVFIKMCEGNPGAMSVLAQIMEHGEKIDPDNALGGLGPILSLDTHEIHGSNIWILFKDVCGQNIVHMIAMLRGTQLGLIPYGTMRDHIFATPYMGKPYTEFEALIASIRKTLPDFGATL